MKVCSVNINGLQNKKTEIINYIKGRDVGILCLQEVKCHQREPYFKDIEKQTQGCFFLSVLIIVSMALRKLS